MNWVSAKIAFYSANQVKLRWHLRHSEGNWSDHIIVHSPCWTLSALASSREARWGICLLQLLRVEFTQLMIVAALWIFNGFALSWRPPLLRLYSHLNWFVYRWTLHLMNWKNNVQEFCIRKAYLHFIENQMAIYKWKFSKLFCWALTGIIFFFPVGILTCLPWDF